ncbi:MAG: DEAD/DEAH box helicase, partial [Gemmatimonadota bacterium]
ALPGAVEIRDRTIALHYEVEESPEHGAYGVVRLQLPEKVARTLVEEELPALDRPLRFVVTRGARGSVRGDSLAEVQEALRQPWSQEERPKRDGHGPRRGPPGPKGRGGRRRR